MSENEDKDLDQVLENDEQEETENDADSGFEGAGPDDEELDPAAKKRIDDLMSKWQKEEARANALQATLEEKSKAPKSKGTGADKGEPKGDPVLQQWLELAKSQARDQVFASDSRFAEYGFDPSSITGDTPEEMKASSQRLSELIDKMYSRVSSATLKKHGLSPEVKSGAPHKGKNINDMSSDEFEKYLERQKQVF